MSSRKLKRWTSGSRISSTAKQILKGQLVRQLGGKCIDCGYDKHLAALDFDHVNPKEKVATLSRLLQVGSYTMALAEAKKCVIRCANCHRIKTFKERHGLS